MSRREAVGRLVAAGRSFSNAFITIQSSSPRTSPLSFLGSSPRLAAIAGSFLGGAQPRARLRRLLLADNP